MIAELRNCQSSFTVDSVYAIENLIYMWSLVNVGKFLYMRGAFKKFPDMFLYRHLKLS